MFDSTRSFTVLTLTVVLLFMNQQSFGQHQEIEKKVSQIESQITTLNSNLKTYASSSFVLFLSGAFCALWAQNTGRNAWLWFFMGMIFSLFAILVLLFKNSADKSESI